MDTLWHYLSTLMSRDGYQRFKKLCRIAKLVLVIPHSNADEERVFSMVRKNKTPFHPSLSLEKTLPCVYKYTATNFNPLGTMCIYIYIYIYIYACARLPLTAMCIYIYIYAHNTNNCILRRVAKLHKTVG